MLNHSVEPRYLNIGCGNTPRERVHAIFRNPSWREIRQDINPDVAPEILCSMTDLSCLNDASMHGLWSSHNLEHLHNFEVAQTLREFRRILLPGGFAIITVPDIQKLGTYLSTDRLTDTLYQSASGPISALDILFGHQESIRRGNQYMAHKTAFSGRLLGEAILAAGFYEVKVVAGNHWDLWALASTATISDELMQAFCEGII